MPAEPFRQEPGAEVRWIGADELHRSLSISQAIDALRTFLLDGGDAESPLRTSLPVGPGAMLIMPAANPRAAGVKLVTVHGGDPAPGIPRIQGVFALFDADSLTPLAIIDGSSLTSLRTPAVTALATQYLARPDASRLVVFGAGPQAELHVDALAAVRPIRHVTIVSRSGAKAGALVARLRERGIGAVRGDEGAVADAEIVCACTSASTPVFDGALLAPGTHVNAIGAHHADERELDDRTMQRGKIVVEERDAALAEAGDVVLAIAAGAISADDVCADLRELVAGEAVRTSADDITVFKSVGVAWEDLVIGHAAYARIAG